MIDSVQDIENVFLEVALKGVGARLEELGIDVKASEWFAKSAVQGYEPAICRLQQISTNPQ